MDSPHSKGTSKHKHVDFVLYCKCCKVFQGLYVCMHVWKCAWLSGCVCAMLCVQCSVHWCSHGCMHAWMCARVCEWLCKIKSMCANYTRMHLSARVYKHAWTRVMSKCIWRCVLHVCIYVHTCACMSGWVHTWCVCVIKCMCVWQAHAFLGTCVHACMSRWV